MLSLFTRRLPLALIVLAAFWLRTHDLERRPMHADEANQGAKAGELLEHGRYAFDPRDHHGPTLYYLALPIAWLRGERTLAELSETTLRLVPAIAGTIAVLLLAMFVTAGRAARDKDPGWPALATAAFLAASPPAVYYSRFFIQETLLATFTLATFVAAQRYSRSRSLSWAIGAGICIGLMLATKASALLFLAAALVATSLVARQTASRAPTLQSGHAVATLATALLVAALFYSSFGTHAVGLRDVFAGYAEAWDRIGGGTGHEKPGWYYLQLFGWQSEGGIFWHQLGLSALALIGAIAGLATGDRLLRWAAIYTGIIAGTFSVVPYKTPWHAVHLVPGLAVLAGGALQAIARLRTGKFVAGAAAFLVLATLAQQSRRAAFLRPADYRNPYAYVHSSPDVLKFRPLVEAALARHPEQPVRVISEEYWPLPWYLRGLPRIGYWPVPPADCDGALVIASATQAGAVRQAFRGTYRESILGLRPGVVLVVFARE